MDYVSHNYEKAVTPNFMQQEALLELTKIRNMHIDRALIVAATGSGKTYLSAFDAKNFGAQKLLFIVHRDVILKDAMNTFKRIFGPTRSYGLYTGDQKDEGVDFLFASNQMLARSLDQFDPKQFDYKYSAKKFWMQPLFQDPLSGFPVGFEKNPLPFSTASPSSAMRIRIDRTRSGAIPERSAISPAVMPQGSRSR